MAGKGRATYEITVDTKGAQADLDGLVRGGAQKFEKLSGAINAATGQLGGLGGVAGKTLATFKQMGEAFLVGGPIGIGLAAGTVAVGLLASKMVEAKEQSDALAKSLADAQVKALEEVTRAYGSAEKELAALAGRSAEYRREQAALALQNARMAADQAAQAERAAGAAARAASNDGGPISRILGIPTEEQAKAQEEWTRASVEATAARARLTAATEELRVAEAALFVSREKGTAPSSRGGAAARERDVTAQITSAVDIEAEQDAAIAARRLRAEEQNLDELIAITEAHEDARAETMRRIRLQAEDDVAARRLEIEQRTTDEISAMHERVFSDYVNLAQGAVVRVSGIFFDTLEQMAAGQEVSLERAAAGFVRGVGEQIVGMGIAQTFEGGGAILRGVINKDPSAIAAGSQLVALGMSAISVGGAMAASGAVAQGAVSARSGGGGGGGSPGGTSSGRVSSRRSGANGEGGDGMSVTYVLVGGTILGDPGDGMRRLEQRRRRELRSVHTPGMA